MSNLLISLIVAAGVGVFVYSKLGRRVGYGNSGNVWGLIGITFVLTFVVVIILLDFILHLGQ